jgi:hypothetical protein
MHFDNIYYLILLFLDLFIRRLLGGGCRVIGFILGLLLDRLLLLGWGEIVMGLLVCLGKISSCLKLDCFGICWSLVLL